MKGRCPVRRFFRYGGGSLRRNINLPAGRLIIKFFILKEALCKKNPFKIQSNIELRINLSSEKNLQYRLPPSRSSSTLRDFLYSNIVCTPPQQNKTLFDIILNTPKHPNPAIFILPTLRIRPQIVSKPSTEQDCFLKKTYYNRGNIMEKIKRPKQEGR